MKPEIFESLSENQRVCLRMVRQAMTSKEIAIALGIAPVTVDLRCKKAIAKLGARDRQDAALMLERHEQAKGVYGQTIYGLPGLAGTDAPADETDLSGGAEPAADLREERASYEADQERRPSSSPIDRLLTPFGPEPTQSVLLLLVLVMAIVIGTAGGVAILEVLNRMRER